MACWFLEQTPTDHCSRAHAHRCCQKFKTRVNGRISCLALAEKIWQIIHGRNPHTQLCCSSHKCLLCTPPAFWLFIYVLLFIYCLCSGTLTSRPSVLSYPLTICWTDWRIWCVTLWTECSNPQLRSCSTTSTPYVTFFEYVEVCSS